MASAVRISKVVSVDDNQDGDRIKVKLFPEDNDIGTIDGLVYAYPLLPKMLHLKPKVGEAVFIITANSENGNSQRYYIGPLISQPTHLEYESYYMDSTSMLKNSYTAPDPAPSMNPQTKGAFMGPNDVGLEGRKNTGLQLTDNDVRVKAGVKITGNDRRDVIFNSKNPSYLKLKYYDREQSAGGRQYNSTATLVADQINLIGTNSKDYFNVTDREELISDEDMKKIIEKAHKLPYGDVLIEFLSMFRQAFLKHVHPFPTLPPSLDAIGENVRAYDLQKILSETVKIN